MRETGRAYDSRRPTSEGLRGELNDRRYVLVEKPRPQVTLITLNRPERMNAMAFDVMLPFRDAIAAVREDNDTRVVVLTGAGEGFCSGADMENPGTMPNIDGLSRPMIGQRALGILHAVTIALRDIHRPVIGAINGAGIGGGGCLGPAPA